MSRGKFIVFEGIDGAGTTTQAQRLLGWLEARGLRVLLTREPSDGPVGNLVRNMLKRRIVVPRSVRGTDADVDPRTVALLFAADRLDHLDGEIRPALDAGFWVLSDRYVDSSLAYQSIYADLAWVREINRFAPRPDCTFFLSVPPRVAMQRMRASRPSRDHFETQRRLEKVDEGYEALYREAAPDVHRLDGTLPIDTIHQRIVETIAPWAE